MKIKKYRVYRFIIGLNLPPIFGATLFFIWEELHSVSSAVVGNPNISLADKMLPILALIELAGFAYVFVGLQSIISSLIMEFLVFKKSQLKRFWLLFGIILGGISGATLIGFGFIMIIIGVLVGSLTSYLLNRFLLLEISNA